MVDKTQEYGKDLTREIIKAKQEYRKFNLENEKDVAIILKNSKDFMSDKENIEWNCTNRHITVQCNESNPPEFIVIMKGEDVLPELTTLLEDKHPKLLELFAQRIDAMNKNKLFYGSRHMVLKEDLFSKIKAVLPEQSESAPY